MALNRAALEALAESIGDGVPIEWERIEAQAGDEERRIIRELRVLDGLAQLHRSLPPVPAEHLAAPLPQRPPDVPAIGNWGHLALLERLGGGTYGEVYRAWDRQLERDVALKVLRADRAEQGRLIAEGRLLARIRHENVVTVYGADTHEGRGGLWMELVRGVTLEQWLGSHGPLSAREAALVGIDLCRALAAIHGAGLVHRDIKAQNVMREDGGRIVLMDLGTGRDIASGQGAAGLAGTPLYLAPELFEGDGHASARTDVYSLGVLLYHLVTGEYPVRAGTFEELQQAHANGRVIRLRDERPDLPAGFVAAIDRALSPDHEARYQSTSALEADLARALEQPAAAEIRPKRSSFTDPRHLAMAALVIAALGLGAYFWPAPWRRGDPVAASLASIRSVAVLPLRNDSGDPSQDYFADGMTDEIISTLGRLEGLRVISRTSSMHFKGAQFKGAGLSLPEIGRTLGADGILEGSILLVPGGRGEPPRVRINARLIAAGTDSQVWAHTFESVARDVIALERQVAHAIAEGIRLRLSAAEERAIDADAVRQGPDFEAFKLYLQGRYYWNLRTKEAVEQSIGYFQQAIARDPKYAAPHAGLADAYKFLSNYGWMPFAEALAIAEQEAERAVALDDSMSEAHASLGLVRDARLDWKGAEVAFRRALELNPGNASAHHWYGLLLSKREAFAEAEAEVGKALTLDPLSPVLPTLLASFRFQQHDYDGAIARLTTVLATHPDYQRAHFILAHVYAKKGQHEEALAEVAKTAALGGNTAELRGLEGCIHGLAGRHDQARGIAEELATRYNDTREGGPLAIAAIYATTGDHDLAFEWLERGRADRDQLLAYLLVDPWFDPLRGAPRFETLLAALGLKR